MSHRKWPKLQRLAVAAGDINQSMSKMMMALSVRRCAKSISTSRIAQVPGAQEQELSALHFIGFKDDRVWHARKVFGEPDFWHRIWDRRARQEIIPGDIAVFANGTIEDEPKPVSWDDSQQDILARGGKEFL